MRDKWSAVRLAYSADQRRNILACIKRLNGFETDALRRIPLQNDDVRRAVRCWYRERWSYLLREYEKVLPRVEELP